MIELDHNATTRPRPEVVEAVHRALTETWHNPSSVHRAGQAARHAVELARAQVARLIGARPRQVVFTGSGTESIDLAIRGVLAARPERPVLVTTRVEHAAVRDLAEDLAERGGAKVRWAPVDGAGVVDTDALAALLDERVALVSVQWANNETGAVQPIERIGALCRARGALFHCDGTQWVGKMPTDVGSPSGVPGAGGGEGGGGTLEVSRPPFDLLTASAHKFHGPKGVGILWTGRGVGLRPVLRGAQELGRRGGTENVPGIVGAGAAAEAARAWLEDDGARHHLAGLRDRLESAVCAAVPGAVVNGVGARAEGGAAPRLWNTTNIGFPRLEAEALLMALSERGLNASAGAACSSGSLEPSPVLLAMGVPPEIAHGSVRLSLGRDTTAGEIEEGIRVIVEAVARLGRSSAALGEAPG